jgi:isoleucyl-tRNA synthetase
LGKELLGLRYKNVYDLKKEGKDFYVTDDNENVKKGEGTGLVHIAPAFGLEDFNLAKKKGLEITCEMNEDGYFRKVESKEVNGKHFTELNE